MATGSARGGWLRWSRQGGLRTSHGSLSTPVNRPTNPNRCSDSQTSVRLFRLPVELFLGVFSAPWLGPETAWNAFYLQAGASHDNFFGEAIINQGMSYQYR